MAEALVDFLLGRLATITLAEVDGEFKLVTGVEKEVKSLTRNLIAIGTVLEDAEQKQVTMAIVGRWLSELTDVCYEMDAVLDEWITEGLKRRMEKQEKYGENALVTTKKVRLPFPSSCFCFGQVNRSMLRRDIAVRIKDLSKRIYFIAKESHRFGLNASSTMVPELQQDLSKRIDFIAKENHRFGLKNISTRVPELRQRTTALPIDKTFGREKERDLIASKLVSESSKGNEIPLIIPIVGMGGMGKTTLAQLVYNDEIVQSHFDKRIWVCVSDPFEEIKISKAIIEGLDKDNTSKNSNELRTLMQCIFELIKGKKFLLVLDDVWNPKFSQWEELIKPLRNGAMGSRVLVTTRNEEVATLMKATTQMIPLKELGEAFCLSLFYYNADMDESSVSKQFKDVGLEIVKRCNGSPFAVKMLGNLMHNKKKVHKWQAVLESRIWDLKEIQQDVFRPLLLSYHDLDPAIKRCFLYCVIFPKDYVFDRDNLIELWMSQDYLHVNGINEPKMIGQIYFDSLAMCSFFQDYKVDKHGKTSCKMKHIVHDFLQYLTGNECVIVDLNPDVTEILMAPNDKHRHLTVLNASGSDSSEYLSNCKKLRTFAALDSSIDLFGQELIVQIKILRTLNLRKNGIRAIAREIGELIHLRYLDLSDNTDLDELPDTLSNLCNLQTLRLANCFGLKTKVDLGRLINLKHLYVDGCKGLKLMGIDRLSNLQKLDTFYIHSAGDVEDNEGNELEDLTKLNQLQGHLTIKNVRHGKYVEAIMVNKVHLIHLVLEFRNKYAEQLCTPEKDREILDGLQPHQALESLTINGYSGTSLSNDWLLSLHSLKRLTLECCCDCEFFPTLGGLASLESLYMGSLYVIKVGVEFLGIDESEMQTSSTIISFPKLRQLSIDYMLFWEEWEGEEDSENIRIMPCLSSLEISNCNYLKALPDFLWKTPLQKLHISGSSILENLYREGTGEKWVKISHIPSTNLGNVCIEQQKDEDE